MFCSAAHAVQGPLGVAPPFPLLRPSVSPPTRALGGPREQQQPLLNLHILLLRPPVEPAIAGATSWLRGGLR
eukprot:7207982-Pyramimonas_sp.AAC.1